MKLNAPQLLDILSAQVSANIAAILTTANKYQQVLNTVPTPNAWSIAQVIEHLNTYNHHYLPAIEQAMQRSTPRAATYFKPGILGNYFVKMMQPVNGRVTKRYKAAAQHIPAPVADANEVIKRYVNDQQQLLDILAAAAKYDLNSIKIPISLNKFIKIKLGDALRFLIAHQQRHFVQIDNLLVVLS